MSNIAYVQKINMEEGKVGVVLQMFTNVCNETYYRLPLLINTVVEPAAPVYEKVYDDFGLGPVRVMAFSASDKVPEELEGMENLKIIPGAEAKDLLQNCFTVPLDPEDIQLSVTSGRMLLAIMDELRVMSGTRNSGWFTHRD